MNAALEAADNIALQMAKIPAATAEGVAAKVASIRYMMDEHSE